MMTSTLPNSKSNYGFVGNHKSRSRKMEPRDIKTKKESLLALERALKERLNEFRELCLREALKLNNQNNQTFNHNQELTGQLPIDYPLQPREPIPQIRRRAKINNSNLSENISIIPPTSLKSRNNMQQAQFLLPSNSINFPNTNKHLIDTLSGNMRPSSTASSLSSSGSATSSTLSTVTIPNCRSMNGILNPNLHVRSYSENISSVCDSQNPSKNQTNNPNTINYMRQPTSVNQHCQPTILQPPTRPPRGLSHSQTRGINALPLIDGESSLIVQPHQAKSIDHNKMNSAANQVSITNQVPINHNLNGVDNFQPYYEETKPFQMSDFYKYSSKHRHNSVDPDGRSDNQPTKILSNNKTTRQLQEDVSKKNLLKFVSCDDQIQASVKLIEKSGQKLIEATARAIAVNPSLAEKLGSILPDHNGDRYQI